MLLLAVQEVEEEEISLNYSQHLISFTNFYIYVFIKFKAVIDLPNRTETGYGFSGLARSVCRIRIQFHET